MEFVVKHRQRSKMFKPKISAIFPVISVLRNNEVMLGGFDCVSFGNGQRYLPRDPILKGAESIFNFAEEARKGHNSYMNLHLESDGRRALIKRID